MDLKLDSRRFVVCGASSGFGKAIADALLSEGAQCIVVARRGGQLQENFSTYGDRVEIVEGDITESKTIDEIVKRAGKSSLHGVVLNAGGPPTGLPLETDMDQWDDAYRLVMRWKIDLTLRLTPLLKENNYGRILFIESKTVKEPLPALVLSNAYRAGVVGFAKSLALEVAGSGVTVNVIAPGFHNTPAIDRVLNRNSELQNISYEEAKQNAESTIPVGRIGKPEELAGLAAWLLSSHSGFITGQTISHDGGVIAGLFG